MHTRMVRNDCPYGNDFWVVTLSVKRSQKSSYRVNLGCAMNLPCQNHGYLVAHLARDYKMYRVTATAATLPRGTPREDSRWRKGHSKQTLKRVMTIRAHTRIWSDSGRTPAIRENHVAVPTATAWLPWSEHPITFDERPARTLG
jgi:xanthine/CO dehydrogenase XdhC/CoxF family maturation factor